MRKFIKTFLVIPFFLMVFLSFAQSEDDISLWETEFNLGFQSYSNNQFDNALIHFKKSEEIATKKLAELPWPKINSKYHYALSLYQLDRFNESLPIFEESLKLVEKVQPKDVNFEFRARGDIAYTYMLVGKPDLAIKKQTKLNEDIKLAFGEYSENYAIAVNTLGIMYQQQGDFINASNNFSTAKIIIENLQLTNSEFYIKIINNEGLCLLSSEKYQEASILFDSALEKEAMLNGDRTELYANILGNQAMVYQKSGFNKEAKLYHGLSLQILSDLFGDNSLSYNQSIVNYAIFLRDISDYDNAYLTVIPAHEKLVEILGEEHQYMANVNLLLGEIYNFFGDYNKSMEYYNKAEKIFIEKIPMDVPGYGFAKLGQGMNFMQLHNYNKAEELYDIALKHIKATSGDTSIEYGKSIINKALLHMLKKEYVKADDTYLTALEIIENKLGRNHMLFATLSNRIAQLMMMQDSLLEFEDLIENAIIVYENNNEKDNFNYYNSLFFKAHILFKKKKYKESLDLFLIVRNGYEKTIGSSSDQFIDVNYQLLELYRILEQNDKVVETLLDINDGFKKTLSNLFTFRGEEDKKIYIEKINSWFSDFNFIVSDSKIIDEKLISTSINNQLFLKGLLLNSTKDIVTSLSELQDSSISNKIQEYRNLKNKLHSSKLNVNTSINSKEIKDAISNLEAELVKLYSNNFNNDLNFEKDWRTIKNGLDSNSIAIEFTNYTYKNEVTYSAYIVKHNSKIPEVVKLFNQDELKNILLKKSPNQLYATRGSKSKNVKVSKGMYDVIWKPLEAYLQNVETIYFSPVGLLNNVPFAALSKEEKLLSDTYKLVQLSSTSLLSEKTIEPKQNNALFIGGINYDFIVKNKEVKNEKPELEFLNTLNGTRDFGTTWNYLPGTLEEINSISNLFSKTNKPYISLTKSKATEKAFKSFSGKSPSVLHIATHGFFFEGVKKMTVSEFANIDITKESVYKVSEDPLMRSGLILAGANYEWQHGHNPYAKENGILTASEISNLDLSKTDMVVLSACNTGLGDIDGSEGVYGLQRAFKMAGVDIIVMSLWEVPDAETSEFMQLFYSNWLGGMKVREAFRDTQRNMSTKYKDTPEKWAAFVLFE